MADKAVEAAPELLRRLGVTGMACILWTVVMSVALWHCDGATVQRLWPYLYFTWLGVAGLSVVGVTLTVALDAMRSSGGAPAPANPEAVAPRVGPDDGIGL
jgi:hypothetical protein